MKTFFKIIVCLSCLTQFTGAQTELKFSSLDSLFSFADRNSSVIKTNEQQRILAKYQKVAALANIVNLRDPLTLSLTNNTQLPVSFIPSVLFGGPPGGFKQITLGQQYVSNFNITPQIDIINAGAWAQVKTAGVNQEITSVRNLINKKSLYESIAACYYNIVSMQEQIEITGKNVSSADTLLLIVKNKFEQGLVRQQDVNDATVNKLTLSDKLNQLKSSLEQQYNSLKILCDIPMKTKVVLDGALNYNQQFGGGDVPNSQLQSRLFMLQAEAAKADLNYNRLSNLPVVSLLYSNSYYQNSNNRLFDENTKSKWLTSAFLGAKVTFFFPDVNKIVFTRSAKVNYHIALVNLEHNKLQNDISNDQLRLDYEKSFSQFSTAQQISLLKEENYKMAFNQYGESILPFDKLLTAFNDMLISRYNYSGALANLLYTRSKIDINNKIK